MRELHCTCVSQNESKHAILTLIFTMVIQKRDLNKLQEITPVAMSYKKEKRILLQIIAMLSCKSLLGYQSHSIKENLHKLSFR